MRCEQVTRELSALTGVIPSPAIAEHLEICSDCANWAERLAQFNQAWVATRPADPEPHVFQRVWTQAVRRVSPAATAVPVFALNRSLMRWSVRGLALAAALVLGWFGLKPLIFQDAGKLRSFDPMHGAIVQISLPPVEAESGETLFIHIGGKNATSECQPIAELSENENIAAEHDVFNHMESLSSL